MVDPAEASGERQPARGRPTGAVVGVDSSTQGTKVEVRDVDTGDLWWSGGAPHVATNPPRSEQDPHGWWEALHPLLGAAQHAVRAIGGTIVGVSIAAQQHGMVVLDPVGHVIRPAKLWNDSESAVDAARLLDALGGAEAWAAACGSVPTASFTVSKLAWLRRCEPANFAQVTRVLLPHDWLTARLTGARADERTGRRTGGRVRGRAGGIVTDRGDASGTGYFSPSAGGWLPEVLELVGIGVDMVPDVLGPYDVAGRWRGATVAPGTGDNMAAALGIGLAPGDIAISVGTSGTVFTVSEHPARDPTGAVAGFADATGRFLPLVCTLNAAKVTDAVARLLGVDAAGLDALAAEAPPGASGLVLVPYLDGERTPLRPGATGSLLGIRSAVSRAELARAAVEGVVCSLLDGLDAMSEAGMVSGDSTLYLVGGAARSAAYQQVLADLAQRPVTVPHGAQFVARGACVQAAAVCHQVTGDAVLRRWATQPALVVEPRPTVDAMSVRQAYARSRDAAAPR